MMDEIEKFLNYSEEQTLVLLSQEISSDSRALDLRTTKEKIDDAKVWMEKNTAKLKQAICGNSIVQNELKKTNSVSKRDLIAAIADAISLVIAGISPFLLAVIIYRGGIISLCGNLKLDND